MKYPTPERVSRQATGLSATPSTRVLRSIIRTVAKPTVAPGNPIRGPRKLCDVIASRASAGNVPGGELPKNLPTIAHVPMALSTASSTLIGVARQLGQAHSRLGGHSTIVLSDNRGISAPELDLHYVDYTRNCPRQWFTKRELAVDILAGAAGVTRPYYGRLYDPAVEALEANPADIVLLYEGHYAAASLPRWQRVRQKSELCLYVHNGVSRTYGRRELTRMIDMCDRVIFCADHLRLSTERRLGRSDPRLTVIPNGVEPLFFRPTRTKPAEFEIVFAGNLSPQKGAHVLLDAVYELENQPDSPPVKVTIVGSSNYGHGSMDQYERQLRQTSHRLRSPVKFTGWESRSEVAEIFGRAGAVCVPSLFDEPFGLVVLEALAAGTPVAVSDAPGPLEVINGIGRVHHMGDALELAGDLRVLATDHQLWQTLSAGGIARAQEFTWDAAVRRVIQP